MSPEGMQKFIHTHRSSATGSVDLGSIGFIVDVSASHEYRSSHKQVNFIKSAEGSPVQRPKPPRPTPKPKYSNVGSRIHAKWESKNVKPMHDEGKATQEKM
jgi:hypothetical protein